MRTRFHGCMKLTAMCCVVVLLFAGTARLLHTGGNSSHKFGKAVSEDSSTFTNRTAHTGAVLVCALPSLEIRGTVAAQSDLLPSRDKPLLQRVRGRAPPACCDLERTTSNDSTSSTIHICALCTNEEKSI
jgi:hypothetical protein